MAGTPTPIFPQLIKNYVQTILPADTTTIKALVVAGTNGTKIESINITSTDTAVRDLAIYATISAVNYLIGTITIPITAGNTNAIPSIDVLRHLQLPSLAYDSNGNKYLYLASGTTLSISVLSTVTTAKQITVFAQGGDY